jgi:hypothetical protein
VEAAAAAWGLAQWGVHHRAGSRCNCWGDCCPLRDLPLRLHHALGTQAAAAAAALALPPAAAAAALVSGAVIYGKVIVVVIKLVIEPRGY